MENSELISKKTFSQLCDELEHWETDPWAIDAILDKEILTRFVYDPCCGDGRLATAAYERGYTVTANDINFWGYASQDSTMDFLSVKNFCRTAPFTVFMNPPFTLAERFVEHALALGARKVVCFQKFSWYEGSFDKGKKRGKWWAKHPPARIWVCGDRATCWRHDIPADERTSGTSTAHAWFVWEPALMPGTMIGAIYRGKGGAA